jgi:sugar phosphate isomerase/epimerase
MKSINRREALMTLSAAGSALLVPSLPATGETSSRKTSMGIVIYAFGIHQKNQWGGRHQGLPPALAMLEESHRLGAGAIMVDLSAKDTAHAAELRRRAEQYEMFVEGSIMPPKTADDVSRFEEDVRVAQTAGADLARTVIMPGRRYEQFKSLAEFREYEQRGLQSLQLATPVLARHKFRLAVENHKDQRVAEKLDTLKKVGSEFIGICVDAGNSFTLMEDPLETAGAFAPYALTVHIKDQAVRENDDGFWFADMAMGEGFLDLHAMIKTLREANPKIRFNLETITRDALNVPILTSDFWATMPDVPARDLARTLKVIKTRSHPKPFPMVSQLSVDQQLALELGNIERSIVYAREQLGLT